MLFRICVISWTPSTQGKHRAHHYTMAQQKPSTVGEACCARAVSNAIMPIHPATFLPNPATPPAVVNQWVRDAPHGRLARARRIYSSLATAGSSPGGASAAGAEESLGGAVGFSSGAAVVAGSVVGATLLLSIALSNCSLNFWASGIKACMRMRVRREGGAHAQAIDVILRCWRTHSHYSQSEWPEWTPPTSPRRNPCTATPMNGQSQHSPLWQSRGRQRS
jgi:hypothetical protein